LNFSENKRSETVGEGSDKVTKLAKLHVKNVAFEATKKELRQLFSPFGQIQESWASIEECEKIRWLCFCRIWDNARSFKRLKGTLQHPFLWTPFGKSYVVYSSL